MAALDDPKFSLDFVGDGPMLQTAISLADKLRLTDRVRFCGLCSDIRERLRNADIFVMHSKYEGMPMALLEAGAEAMPVLSTPASGSVISLLENGRGWIAPPEQFAATIKKISLQPSFAIDTGKQLYNFVKDYHSIGSITRLHEKIYIECLDK
jgi:glycosyltransferase involved in cell wall biosynthesis